MSKVFEVAYPDGIEARFSSRKDAVKTSKEYCRSQNLTRFEVCQTGKDGCIIGGFDQFQLNTNGRWYVTHY